MPRTRNALLATALALSACSSESNEWDPQTVMLPSEAGYEAVMADEEDRLNALGYAAGFLVCNASHIIVQEVGDSGELILINWGPAVSAQDRAFYRTPLATIFEGYGYDEDHPDWLEDFDRITEGFEENPEEYCEPRDQLVA